MINENDNLNDLRIGPNENFTVFHFYSTLESILPNSKLYSLLYFARTNYVKGWQPTKHRQESDKLITDRIMTEIDWIVENTCIILR